MFNSALRRSWLLAAMTLTGAGPTAVCLGADGLRAPIGPHACCHAVTAECIRITAAQACLYPWVEQGNLTFCWGIRACYLPGDDCIEIDGICCDDQGGTPGGFGSECPVPEPEACQLPDGTCTDVIPSDCTASNGTPLGAGTVCAELGACCLKSASKLLLPPFDTCVITDWQACYNTMAGFPGRPGTNCSDLSDNDLPYPDHMPDVCDNCPGIENEPHLDPAADCDGSGVIDAPTEDPIDRDGDGIPDYVQCDTDLDGTGNMCDNCESDPNGWWDGPNDQLDCDGDEIGDVCDPIPLECDDDGFDDDCDDDIDGDGVPNDVDVCDYTPGPVPTAGGVDIIREEGHPLRGTFLGDLDGDCDVDDQDRDLLLDSYTNEASCAYADGTCNRELDCTGCGPCDSCCTGFPD